MSLHHSILRCALITVSLLMASGVAHSQLVKRVRAKPAAAAKTSLSQDFAKYVGEALGREVQPAALKEGLPLGMVLMIEARYKGTNRSRLVAKYQVHAQAFDARWQAYRARLGQVKAAVAAAVQLTASGKQAEAQKGLISLITPTSMDERSGKIKVKRDILEIYDAEIPALVQLAKIAASSGTPQLFADITAALYSRRRVSDVQSERLLWLEGGEKRNFTGLGAGLKAGASRAVQLVDQRRYASLSEGKALSSGLFWAIDAYGISRSTIYNAKSAKKGKWALFSFGSFERGMTRKVTAKSLVVKVDKKWREPYNCKSTNKLQGYDPVSNRFIYEKRCQYKEKKVKASLSAVLVSPPPAWTQTASTVWMIGKVKRAGKNWKISSAHLVDFRFLGRATLFH